MGSISEGHADIANINYTEWARIGDSLVKTNRKITLHKHTPWLIESVGVWQEKTGYEERHTITHSYSLDISKDKQWQHTSKY